MQFCKDLTEQHTVSLNVTVNKVCIEDALHGEPIEPGVQHQKWIQCPNSVVPSIPRHARWFILTHIGAFSEPTLL